MKSKSTAFLIRLLLIPLIASAVLPALVRAQALPTIVTVPFYDTNQTGLSFKKDKLSTMGLYEIPGHPKFFVVLGYWGYLWTLYPDTSRGDTTISNINVPPANTTPWPVAHYTRTQVANFNNMTLKGWEQGALGGTFDPNFATNHYFYVIYNKYASASSYHTGTTPTSVDGPGNAGLVNIDRYIVSADLNTWTRDTTIMSMPHGTGYGSSNMVFGGDGYLYVTEDAYNSSSWDSTNPMRKILRIDVTHPSTGVKYGNNNNGATTSTSVTGQPLMYTVPSDNPWVAAAAANPSRNYVTETWAYGFRNSFSITADYVNPGGDIWAAEVGQSTWEEVNHILPGHNYGWDNGGDNSTAGTNSFGTEGPCSALTTAGEGLGSTNITNTGTLTFHTLAQTYNGHTFTCADMTNGVWNFAHGGAAVNGIATSLPGTSISCMTMSAAYRGQTSSPFYGYRFITDTQRAYFLAVKDSGSVPVNVGTVATQAGINNSSCPGQHDGPVGFGEDSYGNMYVWLVCSSSTGAENWHDIYQLYSPTGMIPLTTPRSQVIPPVTPGGSTAILAGNNTVKSGVKLMSGLISGALVQIPKGYSGLDVYNLEGRLVWSYRGANASVRMPANLGMGILQARFVP